MVKRILGRGLFTIFFLIPVALILEVPIFLAGVGLGSYLVYSRDLPKIPKLASYQPRTVSTFFADDGTVIGVFYKQKRFVVDLDQIPPHVVNAFLAAEDRRFFEHSGVDWVGLARAAGLALMTGRISQGGSTITMQVTRNFFLTREKRFSRKVKEMILAFELERVWGKEKILYIYLNEIYLGEGSYGVEAAARTYFDKPVQHLNVAEAAMIAGLVASPARYNPFKSMERASQRQATVLGRMLRAGFLTKKEYEQAQEQPLRIKKDVTQPFDLVPDFAEAVRRYILKKYGEEKLLNEGLKVFTTCRVDYQQRAQEALERGLKEIKKRQKHLAILRTVPVAQISELLSARSTPELRQDRLYQGVVVKVTHQKNGETELHVALSKRLSGRVKLPRKTSAYRVGHVLALRFDRFVGEVPYFSLDDDPTLQGALVCIENRTGYVRALVGGASGERFKFNRATQAKRQPGSAFKPIIYSVALERRSYSPATIIVDEPIVVDMQRQDEEWEPKNAGGDFLGPLSFRRALELSRNICTIKILMDVGFDPVIETARKMGIRAALGRNLSLSLGTSEVTLLELTSAYTVFPNSGIHVEPVFVKRIEDRFGDVLEDNSEIPTLDESEIPHPVPREEFAQLWAQESQLNPLPEENLEEADTEETDQPSTLPQAESTETAQPSQPAETHGESGRAKAAMSPQTAYIMTSLLQGGVRQGTGARLSQYMNRKDVAGKTGTTNNAEDTWFVGFNPDFTTGVWVGFDEKRPLGREEAGGRAALPVWAYFTKEILAKRPEREFPVPPGIMFEQALTYAGNTKEGFQPKVVTEPVYRPFHGRTLVLSPLDPPESLAEYLGQAFPQGQYPPLPTSGYPAVPGQPPGWHITPGPPVGMPPPQPVVPVHPMEERDRSLQAPQAAPQGPGFPGQVPGWRGAPMPPQDTSGSAAPMRGTPFGGGVEQRLPETPPVSYGPAPGSRYERRFVPESEY